MRVSTPRKKGKPPLQPERGVACTLQLTDTRADLKALLSLASQFGLEHLHTRYTNTLRAALTRSLQCEGTAEWWDQQAPAIILSYPPS